MSIIALKQWFELWIGALHAWTHVLFHHASETVQEEASNFKPK